MSGIYILAESLENMCVKSTTFYKVNCLYNCIKCPVILRVAFFMQKLACGSCSEEG